MRLITEDHLLSDEHKKLREIVQECFANWQFKEEMIRTFWANIEEYYQIQGISPHIHCSESAFILAHEFQKREIWSSFILCSHKSRFHFFLKTSFQGEIFYIDMNSGYLTIHSKTPPYPIIKEYPFRGEKRFMDTLPAIEKIGWIVRSILHTPHLRPNAWEYYTKKCEKFNHRLRSGIECL